MKKFPYFLIIAALYPVVSLYALNISEINITNVIRPLIFSLICVGILFGVLVLVLRDKQKAAIVATILFLVFSSYGAFYNVTKGFSIGKAVIGSHRVLLPFVTILTLIILWLVIKRMRPPYSNVIQGFNFGAILLLAFPLVQIGMQFNYVKLPARTASNAAVISSQTNDDRPDVYYFLLDSYPRADFIRKWMDYDNTPFLDALKQRGFYVADCSLSNYSYTRLSLATSMNMNYIEELGVNTSPDNKDVRQLDPLIVHPKVRADFEKAGYQSVAFETGYLFTEWRDADHYFQPESNPFTMPVLTPFEGMLLQNTEISAGLQYQRVRRLFGLTFPYYEKWQREHYIIDQVKKIPEIPGAKFVFIHLVTTHRPYVFQPDGSILNDERYYIDDGVPINDEYYVRGFQYQLQFTNSYMLDLIDTILKNSKNPPVIILQGDHGVRFPGRQTILNALLIPNPKNELYPEISPVNNFRIVENSVLGTQLDLLEDTIHMSLVNKSPYKFRSGKKTSACEIH